MDKYRLPAIYVARSVETQPSAERCCEVGQSPYMRNLRLACSVLNQATICGRGRPSVAPLRVSVLSKFIQPADDGLATLAPNRRIIAKHSWIFYGR